jgi:hypothetical protein
MTTYTLRNKNYDFATNIITDNNKEQTLYETDIIQTLNSQGEIINKLKTICQKYRIPLADVPEILEAYIDYDNEEYLEKLKCDIYD